MAEKTTPELTEDFAKSLGYASLAAMREAVRAKKMKIHEDAADRAAGQKLLEMAGANLTVAVPEAALDRAADNEMKLLTQRLSRSGISMEQHCKNSRTTADALRAGYRADAERKIRTMYAARAIAEAEGITVRTEEVNNEYRRLSVQQDTPEADIRRVLTPETVAAALAAQKVQRFLLDNAVVASVMDADKETDEGKADFEVENVKGDIDFKHIDFSYVPEKQVLKDLDLEVKAGQKIAIVGATGSGKTTIVNLLTRFYPVDSGEITIDGQSIYDIPKDKLRRSIAIVLQDTVLFKDTIEENIRYGRENATLDEIKAAAKFANADEFIERLPEGYDTVLAEGGSNLSQGQRQLLSIARAVLADPKILILDEATSSVDTRTEMHIQSAMVALMKNRTSLIIAHRLSTIRDADKIVVIDGGRVAEQGSHEELIAAKGCYYRLYQTQFSGVKT